MEKQRNAFVELFNKKKVKLPMILAKFSCIDLEDLIKTFGDYLSNDFDYIINNEEYMLSLNLFFMDFWLCCLLVCFDETEAEADEEAIYLLIKL